MLLTIITFLIILGILVLAHEAGHFLSCRIFGVKAEEFGFGYPPRIFGWVKTNEGKKKIVGPKESSEKYKNTVWSLNWLPLGGFVKIKGEDGTNNSDTDGFGSHSVWQRFIILFAGVFMNFVLACIILSIGFSIGIPSVLDEATLSTVKSVQDVKVQVIAVENNSPAKENNLKPGDTLLSIAGQPINSVSDVQDILAERSDEKTKFKINSMGEEKELEIIPQFSKELNRAVIGISLVKTGIVTYPWYTAIWKGFQTTWNLLIAMFVALWGLLKNLISSGQAPADISGPIGIAVMTGQFAKMGFVYLLQFSALLSINLAILNILPFPALDGGRIVFLVIEAIRRKKNNEKVEAIVHNIGFILLMVLVLLVTYKDIVKFGGGIIEKIF